MNKSDKQLRLKSDINLILKTLSFEDKISDNTYKGLKELVSQIVDNPFELFDDLVEAGTIECNLNGEKVCFKVTKTTI